MLAEYENIYRQYGAKGSAMLDFWSSDKINENELPVVWWIPDENSRTGGSIQGYAGKI